MINTINLLLIRPKPKPKPNPNPTLNLTYPNSTLALSYPTLPYPILLYLSIDPNPNSTPGPKSTPCRLLNLLLNKNFIFFR